VTITFIDRPAAVGPGDEVDFLEALLGDCQVANRDVGEALREVAEQLVASRRCDVDREGPPAEHLRVLRVEIALPVTHQLDREPTLTPPIVEVERARVRCVDADHPPLEHLFEVARPRLVADGEASRNHRSIGGRRLAVRGGRARDYPQRR
jgi:hypothetical protein